MTEISMPGRRRGRPPSARSEGGGEVQSLDRAITLIELVAGSDGITMSEIARRAKLPASTVHRLLATLEHRGLVGHDPATGLWVVGVGLFRVGSAYLRMRRLPEIGRPLLRALQRESNETVNIAMAEGGELVCVAQIESHAPMRVFFRAGSRLPVHASAAGKAILAALAERERERRVREIVLQPHTERTLTGYPALLADLEKAADRGYAVDDGEFVEGMCGVAAAVLDEWREPVGAVSVMAPSVRLTARRRSEVGQRVWETAAEMTRLYSGKGG